MFCISENKNEIDNSNFVTVSKNFAFTLVRCWRMRTQLNLYLIIISLSCFYPKIIPKQSLIDVSFLLGRYHIYIAINLRVITVQQISYSNELSQFHLFGVNACDCTAKICMTLIEILIFDKLRFFFFSNKGSIIYFHLIN